MAKEEARNIEEIIEHQWLVRFDRAPFDEGTLLGFVLDANDEFTLVNIFDWKCRLDGYTIIRNKTIKKFRVYDDPDSFEVRFIALKKIKPKPLKDISIASVAEILETVGQQFPLLGFYREKKDDVIYIGKVIGMSDKKFSFKLIDYEAFWHKKTKDFSFKDVTRVDFGGGYEEALHLIAEQRTISSPKQIILHEVD